MTAARACLLAAALLGAACFRLSDPFYAAFPLRPHDPIGPEYSLVFLTFESEGGLFARDIETIYFKRVDPADRDHIFHATESFLFRVFEVRAVKDGDFLVNLPPGVYELHSLRRGRETFLMDEPARVVSRIYVTRPGLYDLGTFRLRREGFFSPYTLAALADRWSPERTARLLAAVRGTPWEGRPRGPTGNR